MSNHLQVNVEDVHCKPKNIFMSNIFILYFYSNLLSWFASTQWNLILKETYFKIIKIFNNNISTSLIDLPRHTTVRITVRRCSIASRWSLQFNCETYNMNIKSIPFCYHVFFLLIFIHSSTYFLVCRVSCSEINRFFV